MSYGGGDLAAGIPLARAPALVHEEGSDAAATKRWRAVVLIAVYQLLQGLSFTIIFVPLPGHLLHAACAMQGLDEQDCKECVSKDCTVRTPGYDEAQTESANAMGVLIFVTGLAQLLTSVLIGGLSDAYGRRLAVLMPNFNMIVLALVLRFCPYDRFLSVGMPVIFLSGLQGMCEVFSQGAFSIVADLSQSITSSRERSVLFTVAESGMIGGFLIGPIIGTTLRDTIGNANAFFIPVAISACNIILILATFRETLEPSRRKPVEWIRQNPFSVLSMFGKSSSTVMILVLALATQFSTNGFITVLSPFGLRVSDSSQEFIGVLVATVSLMAVLGLTIGMPLLVKRFSLSQILTLSTGSICIGCVCYTVCTKPWQLLVLSPLGAFAMCALPILRMTSANLFGKSCYGQSQAAMACVDQVGNLAAGPLMNYVYGATDELQWTFKNGFGIQCVSFLFLLVFAATAFVSSFFVGELPSGEEAEEGDAVKPAS